MLHLVRTQRLLLTLACFLAVPLTACAPTLRDIHPEEARQDATSYVLKYNKDTVLQAFEQAITEVGYHIDRIDNEQGLVTGATPVGLVSWGEVFSIYVEQKTFDSSTVYIRVDRKLATNLAADTENVKRILLERATEDLSHR